MGHLSSAAPHTLPPGEGTYHGNRTRDLKVLAAVGVGSQEHPLALTDIEVKSLLLSQEVWERQKH